MSNQANLALAVKAAKAAGQRLLDGFDDERVVLAETAHDIKLQADRDAEAIILDILSASGLGVLAEESGEHGDVDSGAPMWAVDPLDGTANYFRGVPVCGVSIGLLQKDVPILGVIYDFNRDELFSGIVGEGATLNGKPMHVSNITTVQQAVLSTGLSSSFDFSVEAFTEMVNRLKNYKKVRMIGSAAVSMANVACGRFDAHAEDNTMLWDVAGGMALIQAAGGHLQLDPVPGKKWSRCIRAAASPSLWERVE